MYKVLSEKGRLGWSLVTMLISTVGMSTEVRAGENPMPQITLTAETPIRAGSTTVMSLRRAEQRAVSNDPERASYEARAQALREQAVAEGQLPDPIIRLGLMNFPTDTFSRAQEPMTQVQIGIQQAFPPGDSLALRAEKGAAMADVLQARVALQHRMALLAVRNAWLEAYYWTRAVGIVRDSHALFSRLVAITRSQYATGRRNQEDVLRAELELGVLKDKELRYLTAEATARAKLARWIGETEAQQDLPVSLPTMPTLPDSQHIVATLTSHPLLLAAQARITVAKRGVELAKESFKPRWMLDVSYGNRTGMNTNGTPRADFVSGMVSMSLPLFTAQRQDRRLAANRKEQQAAQDLGELQLRKLRQSLDVSRAEMRLLNERIEQYKIQLVPQARQTANAALRAYQSDAGNFSLLMRARINDLETRLKMLRLQVDRAVTHSTLLYLTGEK